MKFQAMLNAALFFLAVVFSGNTLAGDPSAECVDQLKSHDELQILKGKIALGSIDDQTLEILSNDDVPTKKRKRSDFHVGKGTPNLQTIGGGVA